MTGSTRAASWTRSPLPEDSEEFVRFWEKQYRGWELVECEKSFNEQTGWYFYLTMRRAHIKQNGGLK